MRNFPDTPCIRVCVSVAAFPLPVFCKIKVIFRKFQQRTIAMSVFFYEMVLSA